MWLNNHGWPWIVNNPYLVITLLLVAVVTVAVPCSGGIKWRIDLTGCWRRITRHPVLTRIPDAAENAASWFFLILGIAIPCLVLLWIGGQVFTWINKPRPPARAYQQAAPISSPPPATSRTWKYTAPQGTLGVVDPPYPDRVVIPRGYVLQWRIIDSADAVYRRNASGVDFVRVHETFHEEDMAWLEFRGHLKPVVMEFTLEKATSKPKTLAQALHPSTRGNGPDRTEQTRGQSPSAPERTTGRTIAPPIDVRPEVPIIEEWSITAPLGQPSAAISLFSGYRIRVNVDGPVKVFRNGKVVRLPNGKPRILSPGEYNSDKPLEYLAGTTTLQFESMDGKPVKVWGTQKAE